MMDHVLISHVVQEGTQNMERGLQDEDVKSNVRPHGGKGHVQLMQQ